MNRCDVSFISSFYICFYLILLFHLLLLQWIVSALIRIHIYLYILLTVIVMNVVIMGSYEFPQDRVPAEIGVSIVSINTPLLDYTLNQVLWSRPSSQVNNPVENITR